MRMMNSRKRNARPGEAGKGPFLEIARSLTQQLSELERLRDQVREAELRHAQHLTDRSRKLPTDHDER